MGENPIRSQYCEVCGKPTGRAETFPVECMEIPLCSEPCSAAYWDMVNYRMAEKAIEPVDGKKFVDASKAVRFLMEAMRDWEKAGKVGLVDSALAKIEILKALPAENVDQISALATTP